MEEDKHSGFQKGVEGDATEGGVEKLDGVENGKSQTCACEGGLHLKDAARIAGDDDAGSERSDEGGLPIAQGVRGMGLDEVVDTRRAAADGRLWNFNKSERGNLREQRARLGAHSLSMLQMA